MANDLVRLGLRETTPGSPVAEHATLRALLCELLDYLTDALAPTDEAVSGGKLSEKVGSYRAMLASAVDGSRISVLGGPLLALCQEAFAQLKRRHESLCEDLASLIVHVRTAVSTITGEGKAFSADVYDSVRRVDALQHITDLRELKTSLAREVNGLREVVRVREQRWKAAVSVFEDRVASLEQQLKASQEEASRDALTGAANRRAFDRALREAVEASARQFVIAIVDVDDFKRINDSFGHATGDTVLRAVADTLKAAVRGDDIVARIGGDEFALITSGLTPMQADRRLRAVIRALDTTDIGIVDTRVTVSCGIAEYSAGDTMDSLMHRADEAVYQAKRQGKNHIVTRSAPFIRDLRAS